MFHHFFVPINTASTALNNFQIMRYTTRTNLFDGLMSMQYLKYVSGTNPQYASLRYITWWSGNISSHTASVFSGKTVNFGQPSKFGAVAKCDHDCIRKINDIMTQDDVADNISFNLFTSLLPYIKTQVGSPVYIISTNCTEHFTIKWFVRLDGKLCFQM